MTEEERFELERMIATPGWHCFAEHARRCIHQRDMAILGQIEDIERIREYRAVNQAVSELLRWAGSASHPPKSIQHSSL
jgi:hypothetical protein